MRMQACVRLGLGLFCMAALTATARLGETEAQSQQRYGAPLKKGEDFMPSQPVLHGAVNLTYKYRGWWVRAAFVEGRAVRLTYTKVDNKKVDPAIEADELKSILEGEVAQGRWHEKTVAASDADVSQDGLRVRSQEFVNTNGNRARIEVGHTVVTVEAPAAAVAELRTLEKTRHAAAHNPKK